MASKDAALVAAERMFRCRTVFFADHTGVPVAGMAGVRRGLSGAEVRVVKNRIAALAASRAGVAVPAGAFVGPLTLVATDGDPAVLAGVLAGGPLLVRSGVVEGVPAGRETVVRLSALGSRDAVLAGVVRVLRGPLTRCAAGFGAVAA